MAGRWIELAVYAAGSLFFVLAAQGLGDASPFAWVVVVVLGMMALYTVYLIVSESGRAARLRHLGIRADLDAHERRAASAWASQLRQRYGATAWVAFTALVAVYGYLFFAFHRQLGQLGLLAILGVAAVSIVMLIGAGSLTARPQEPDPLPRLARAITMTPEEAPSVTRALQQALIAVGVTTPAHLMRVPTEAVNAFLARMPQGCSIGVTDGLIRTMDDEELVAVFANLLGRLDWQSKPIPELSESRRPIPPDPQRCDLLDFFAECDDAAVLLTRDPGALVSALAKTAAASDTRVNGLRTIDSYFLWTAPRATGVPYANGCEHEVGDLYAGIEQSRMELLRPVAGAVRLT